VTKSPRELRRFGLTVGGAFLLLGALSAWRGHVVPPRVLWTLGVALVLLGLIVPRALGPVEVAWMRLAATLGHWNASLILALLFYLVVTPVGWVVRRLRDPMDRRLDDGKASHWIRRTRAAADLETYRHQF